MDRQSRNAWFTLAIASIAAVALCVWLFGFVLPSRAAHHRVPDLGVPSVVDAAVGDADPGQSHIHIVDMAPVAVEIADAAPVAKPCRRYGVIPGGTWGCVDHAWDKVGGPRSKRGKPSGWNPKGATGFRPLRVALVDIDLPPPRLEADTHGDIAVAALAP